MPIPLESLQQGTPAYAEAIRANQLEQTILRAGGDPSPFMDQITSAISGRNKAGFDAGMKGLSESAMGATEQIKQHSAEEAKLSDAASRISASLALFRGAGGSLSESSLQNIHQAAEKGDVAQLEAFQSDIANQLKQTREAQGESMAEAMKLRDAALVAKPEFDRFKSIASQFVVNGQPTARLRDAVGFGEEWIQGPAQRLTGQRSATDQQQLRIEILETDVLDKVQLLSPISPEEITMIKNERPRISDTPEAWASYITMLQNRLETAQNAALNNPALPSSGGAATQGVAPSAAAQSLLDRRAKAAQAAQPAQ